MRFTLVVKGLGSPTSVEEKPFVTLRDLPAAGFSSASSAVDSFFTPPPFV